MLTLDKNELYVVQGGAFNYTMINAIARAASTIFTIGQAIGSAVRRATSRRYC